MAGYKLATYQTSGGPRAGLIVDDKVFDAAKLTGKAAYASVLGILNDWKSAQGALKKAAAKAGKSRAGQPLARTKLRAPVLWPSAIYCAGANYKDHAEEMSRLHNRPPEADPHTLGLKPWHFIKIGRVTLSDPGAIVKISQYSKSMDWEVELAAIIGREAKNLPLERALSCVAGYTIGNDLSARDLGPRANVDVSSPFKHDWVRHKSFDGSCPLGPWIVPASDIRDPQKLAMKLWVNDVIKQDSNTAKMIFTLAEQIAHISSGATLYPGDVIMTGTPSGVGAARREFLKAGDTVKLWIEKIGTLTNRMG